MDGFKILYYYFLAGNCGGETDEIVASIQFLYVGVYFHSSPHLEQSLEQNV